MPGFAEKGLQAIDLFGTEQVTLEQIERLHGKKLRAFAQAQFSGAAEKAARLQGEIEQTLRESGDFVYVKLSLIRYEISEPGGPGYLTLDFVDTKDKAKRMPFRDPPTGSNADPEGLLELWNEYETLGWDLARKGQIDFAQADCGKAFHCLFGYDHPRLKTMGETFHEKVPKSRDELVRTLSEDRYPANRASAAFLLAHHDDGNELVRILLPAFRDPESLVRNNAMRVLAHMSVMHKNVAIPLDPVLEALNYPDTTDRNKAAGILAGIADRPKNKKPILEKAGFLLLQLLRLSQPNNHDFAYRILKSISGKDFGEHDHGSWKKWIAEASKTQADLSEK